MIKPKTLEKPDKDEDKSDREKAPQIVGADWAKSAEEAAEIREADKTKSS